jgi:small ligand-binding sensory domain FIST
MPSSARSSTRRRSIQIVLVIVTVSSAVSFTGLGVLPHHHPVAFPSTTTKSALRYLREPAAEDSSFATTLVSSPAKFTSCASRQSNAILAIDELVQGLAGNYMYNNNRLDLVTLFVGQYHAQHFEKICSYLQIKLAHKNKNGHDMEILSILGGGVIGGGEELDQEGAPAMTLLAGKLPPASYASVFQYQQGVDKSVEESLTTATKMRSSSGKNIKDTDTSSERPPSYMVFSDPFAPLDDLLSILENPSKSNPKLPPPVIAGGVSVPPRRRGRRQLVPSIARNGRLLPPGSLVGVEFTGNVGLMAVVAQGCRPVGPTYVITQATKTTILTGLSGESAITRLEEVAAAANRRDQELIRNGELVCGIGSSSNILHEDNHHLISGRNHKDYNGPPVPMVRMEDDFLIRQIMGFQPKSGSIVVAAGGLKEGSTFRFHVRAAKSAREDMDLMIQRAKTERLFAGSSNLLRSSGPVAGTGKPLAALQVSCVARGRSFFGAPNVDLKKVEELFDEDNDGRHPPVAGFFANGEIGPVGIRSVEMAAKDAEQADSTATKTFLHGFTTVVAMLCDYSDTSTTEKTGEVSSSAIICREDAWA